MYYYFRLILHMFLKDNEKPAQVQAGRPLAFAYLSAEPACR